MGREVLDEAVPHVKVRFYTPLREKIQQSEMTVVGYSGAEVLNNVQVELGPTHAQELFADNGEVRHQYLLIHNENTVAVARFKKSRMQRGDIIRFVLPIAGG